MKTEILNVTEQDIALANQARIVMDKMIIESCPIAQSAKRQVESFVWACEHGLYAHYNVRLYTLSEEAQKFMSDWDNNVPVQPQEFTITKV